MVYTELLPTKTTTENDCFHQRWELLRMDLLWLINHRLGTGAPKWYERIYRQSRDSICSLIPRGYQDINGISRGLMAEFFFQRACLDVGISCEPTSGYEDVLGADFRVQRNGETRFLDVTTNPSKVRKYMFPVIHIPWSIDDNYCRLQYTNWAELYMAEGIFNGRLFLDRTKEESYKILRDIIEAWDSKDGSKLPPYINAYDLGPRHISELTGVLEFL